MRILLRGALGERFVFECEDMVDGVPVTCQVGINITAVGSKELPVERAPIVESANTTALRKAAKQREVDKEAARVQQIAKDAIAEHEARKAAKELAELEAATAPSVPAVVVETSVA